MGGCEAGFLSGAAAGDDAAGGNEGDAGYAGLLAESMFAANSK